MKEEDTCPICRVPYGRKETGRRQENGLCKSCDDITNPRGGLNADNVLPAARQAGASIVMDGTNYTAPAKPNTEGFRNALQENGCVGQGKLTLFADIEKLIGEALVQTISNATGGQYIRYKPTIVIEDCQARLELQPYK